MTALSVLAIGSHPDDVELGCGAAMLAHRALGHRTSMLVMTAGERSFQGSGRRRDEQAEAARSLGAELLWGHFADCEIPAGRITVDCIEEAISAVGADIIYAHAPEDSHQDHRVVSAAALSAARRHSRILLYPTPSTARFEPSVFVDVDRYLEGKLYALGCHESQVKSGSIRPDAVAASARHWGAIARVRLAEAFVPVRFVWDAGSCA